MKSKQSGRFSSRYWGVAARGLAMGAADVVPGVSGGTIAFITGIYQELLDSLSRIGPHTLKILIREGFAAAWQQINGNFLLALFSGILLSIFSLAKLIGFFLHTYPIVIWAFFFGLILASALPVLRGVPKWSWPALLCFIAGVLTAVLISELRPGELVATPLTLFLSGALAVCAMILPGISGAFILLLIGIYPKVLAAVHELQLLNLICFAAGAVTGLLLFSRLLSWLMRTYVGPSLAFLAGILLGSLKIVWPWKLPAAGVSVNDKLAPLMSNTTPEKFAAETGQNAYLTAALIAAFAAVLLVLAVDYFGQGARRGNQLGQKSGN
jgi:putative membrane protein